MKKFICLTILTVFAASVAFAQSPSPSEMPSASPAAKHKRSKKKEAAAMTSPSPSEMPDASPAAKHKRSKKKETTEAAEPSGTVAPGGGPGMVWVNSESHVYHKEGSRWYGRTKKGKYMTESEAIKEGDRSQKESGNKKE